MRMKAIVAKVLFGGIFGCISCPTSVFAIPKAADNELPTTNLTVISAQLFSRDRLPTAPQITNFVGHILTINKSDSPDFDFAVEQNLKIGLNKDFREELKLQNKPKSSLNYLNQIDAPRILASEISALKLSEEENRNLARKNDYLLQESSEFRGKVSYFQSVAEQVTMGVEFASENPSVGFTQFTYESSLLPLKTTVSLIANESNIDLNSHVLLKPLGNLVFNYYGDRNTQRFDVNWGVTPGLSLIANSNSGNKFFSMGIKVAVHNDFLSLSADAALDNKNNVQWNLNSTLGRFEFVHGNNQQKSDSELNFRVLDSNTYGFQCSTFFKYQTHAIKQNEEQFTTLGGRLSSARTINKNRHRWTLDLGYGSGPHGGGIIVSGSVALKTSMFLNLTYQEVSSIDNDTRINLLLNSN